MIRSNVTTMCTICVRRGISITKFEIDDVIGCFSVKNVAKSGQLYILSLPFPPSGKIPAGDHD